MPEPDQLSLIKRAYLAVERAEARVAALEAERRTPLALVGLGLRLPPHLGTPEELWRFLAAGGEARREIPEERWSRAEHFHPDPEHPGTLYCPWAALLDDVAGFDAPFFGITPREAVALDPQQRLLLEVAWEALERAGISPTSLAGSRTGVWVGITGADYLTLQKEAMGPEEVDAWHASGAAHSVASGRLSYLLGLTGPSLSIDTACSSSLVALHLACRSLRSRETDLAIVAGVNLILAPDNGVAFSRARMLAPDGRSKAFDARADGFGRGEGCVAVVLARLEEALAAGYPVRAVVRGTAVNQDGATSGLTVPNGPSQERLIREALADAGLAPAEVAYVEAHGTGTALGDPIEAQALAAALGEGREAARPLLLGSIKTNLGHLEAAAGLGGLIKLVLALEKGEIPPHLHFDTPSPHVPWGRLPLEVVRGLRPWPEGYARRRGGVSSFGFSGTNAHVVVEEAPHPTEAAVPGPSPQLVVLSAKTATALSAQSGRWAAHLEAQPELEVGAVAYTAAVGRAALAHRRAVIARDLAGAAAALRSGEGVSGVVPAGDPPKLAVLFSGQGTELAGTGAELYGGEPRFREALDEAAGWLLEDAGWDLRGALFGGDGRLASTEIAQPCLFAVGYGLWQLYRSWGVAPVALLGDGVGEVSAICAAGMLPWREGLRLVTLRGRLMQATTPGQGEPAAAAELERAWAALGPLAPGEIDVVWNLTGGPIDPAGELTPAYWARRLLEPLRIADGLSALRGRGVGAFLELGLTPALLPAVSAAGEELVTAASLRQGWGDRESILDGLARLWVAGVGVDLGAVAGPGPQGRVELPTYPWEHQRYWITPRRRRRPSTGALPEALAAGEVHCLDLAWRPAPSPVPASGSRPRVLWAAGQSDEACLAGLREAGAEVRLAGLRPAGEDSPLQALVSLLLSLVERLRAGGEAAGPWWVVTRGAVAAGDTEGSLDPLAAALWGFSLSLAQERPELGLRLLDLDPDPKIDPMPALLAELAAADEGQVAWRGGRRHLARLVPRSLPQAAPPELAAEATYLVTGGTGALGLEVAQWLADCGARHLVLVSRSGGSSGARPRLAELAQRGVEVHVARADVADAASLARGLSPLLAHLPPLRGVVHAAGERHDALLEGLDASSLEVSLRAKVEGLWQLERLTRGSKLDFFVSFSSLAAVLGGAGQAAYAAANAYLDAWARRRRAEGAPLLSVAWGPWAGGGMAEEVAAAHRRRWARLGVADLAPRSALSTLGNLLAAGSGGAVVVALDEQRLHAALVAADPAPLLSELAPVGPRAEAAGLAAELAALAPEQRGPRLQAQVLARAAAVMALDAGTDIDPAQPLQELGMDSLMAVELRNRLARDLGLVLPASLVFDYPTPERLAAHLAGELGLPVPAAAEPAPTQLTADDLALLEELERLSGEDAALLLEAP
ncbi:MAG TPA: SDR family NAD(P)-dependent oxidoreductase [Thermoanaerobaculia bacterium]|nr:SDR family NAD(P)-dependent oxidoreductase [Thermoanaerobaculia bacterium]